MNGGNSAIIQGQPAPAPGPVAYPAPYPYAYPYAYPLGFTPILIAAPGWYHGRYFAYRRYYDPMAGSCGDIIPR